MKKRAGKFVWHLGLLIFLFVYSLGSMAAAKTDTKQNNVKIKQSNASLGDYTPSSMAKELYALETDWINRIAAFANANADKAGKKNINAILTGRRAMMSGRKHVDARAQDVYDVTSLLQDGEVDTDDSEWNAWSYRRSGKVLHYRGGDCTSESTFVVDTEGYVDVSENYDEKKSQTIFRKLPSGGEPNYTRHDAMFSENKKILDISVNSTECTIEYAEYTDAEVMEGSIRFNGKSLTVVMNEKQSEYTEKIS